MTGVSPKSSGRQMLHGASWMIALRWALRLTGVVSTVILARLLTPQDFGVVAIAMVAVGLFEMLSWTGQGLALIRLKEPTREHYDTAWTISVLIGVGIAIAIFLAAPLTRLYFHDERAVLVIQFLALRPLLSGLENIGTTDFRRDLRFQRVFGYIFYAKLISFSLTLILAFTLRNYWALVAGIITGQLARTALSYVMHPYRPRFSVSRMSDIWSFSIWSLVRAIGTYFMSQVDIIAVGGVAGPSQMGRYTVAKDVASSPVDELNAPMVSVLFPVMAKVQHDPDQLRSLYLRTLSWSAIIGVSTGIGVTMVAPDMVGLILGAKWISISPLIGWMAMTAGLATLTDSGFSLLDIQGLPHVGARLQWLRVALLALGIFPVAYLTHSLITIAAARLLMTFVFVPSLLIAVGRYTGIRFTDQAAALWRPATAGAVLAASVWTVNNVLPINGALRLVVDVPTGAVSYGMALLALWALSGCPASAERDLLGLLTQTASKIQTLRSRELDVVH